MKAMAVAVNFMIYNVCCCAGVLEKIMSSPVQRSVKSENGNSSQDLIFDGSSGLWWRNYVSPQSNC
jgi:hypothetical protein